MNVLFTGIRGCVHRINVGPLKKVVTVPFAQKHKRWTERDCVPPESYENIEIPPDQERKLPILPNGPDVIPLDRRRKMYDIRGPCIGEDAQMQNQQYAIMALKGGNLKPNHFEMIRNCMNFGCNIHKSMFAFYRVKPPYKPVTRHPKNAVMGGGKGKVHHYVTPIKARQIILEVGGQVTFEQAYRTMKGISTKLPFPAIAVSYEMLQEMYEEERRLEEENENFFTFRELAIKNMCGVRSKLTLYDLQQFGKYK